MDLRAEVSLGGRDEKNSLQAAQEDGAGPEQAISVDQTSERAGRRGGVSGNVSRPEAGVSGGEECLKINSYLDL